MKAKTSMNLFELIDAIDQIDKRLEIVEKFSHEPQNYKKKCDEMEKRIIKLENLPPVKSEKEIVEDWQKKINKRKAFIEKLDKRGK